jgi:N-acetylmuramoyl-L-alanine amidase
LVNSVGVSNFPLAQIESTDPPGKSKVYTIVIDPGHGGKDAGCSGNHSHEKDIVLAIGHHIKKLALQKYPELKIIMTREKDKFIPLHERAEIANNSKADLFLSLHCNSIGGKSHVHGSETYVLGLHRAEDNLRVAKRENSAILYENDYKAQYDGFDPSSAEGHIILSMYQNAYLEQSIHFAHLVEGQLTSQANRHSRGVKQAGFLVLRETTMPSVLIETGFLTNAAEERFLSDLPGQKKVAQSILTAIEEYAYLPSLSKEESASPSTRYGVELLSTSQPLDKAHELWKRNSNLTEWITASNSYKYIVPAGSSKDEARKKQQQVKSRGIKDAFIIPWPQKELVPSHVVGTK